MIVYLDLVFILDCLMNFFLLSVVNKIIDNMPRIKRMILGSVVGGFCTILCVVMTNKIVVYIRSICAFLIVIIVYGKNNFLKNMITLYLTTFLIGGICYYSNGDLIRNCIYIIGLVVFIKYTVREYKEHYKISNFICKIVIEIESQMIEMRALIDTGDFLKGCLGEEVIVISKNIVKKIRTNEIKNLLLNNKVQDLNIYKDKLRIVPFSSLGNSNDFKYGMFIKNTKFKYEKGGGYKDAIIICSNSNLKMFDAIVSLDYIKDKKEVGNGDFINNERKSEKTFYEISNVGWG